MRNPDRETIFRFKRFAVTNSESAMKIGTDSVALGAWIEVDGVRTALDVGAGSGVLSLMLAQRGVMHVTAIEIDAKAAEEASKNVAASEWADRIKVIKADVCNWSESVLTPPLFDLIISNPPYFSSELKSPLADRATARHEGTLSFKSLMKIAKRHLSPGGRLAIIAPTDRLEDIKLEAAISQLNVRRLCFLSTSPKKAPKRVMMEICAEDCATPMTETISVSSDEFKLLTKDFYLDR